MINTLITFLTSFAISVVLLPYSNTSAQSSSCQLPEWLFTPSNYNTPGMAVGISDIRMEKEEAYKEAKLKALLNYSLLHNAKFSSLTTSGIGNQQDNTYSTTSLEYIVLSAIVSGEIYDPSNIEVIDSFYTQNKEAIVLIRIDESKEISPKFSFSINRRAGFQKENSSQPFFVDEIDLLITENDSIIYASEILKESNLISNSKVKASMNMFEYLADIQFFKPYNNYSQPDPRALPSPLNFGLWNSYIFNLVDQICIYNSFKTDFHHKLSGSNVGNIGNGETQKTIQQYVYSLKNIQSREIKTNLNSIATLNNQLLCYFIPESENFDFSQNTISMLEKEDKKELKKLKAEDWKFLGTQNVKTPGLRPRIEFVPHLTTW
ncbi:MAG: hypothetical protein HC831_11735 [Chloroflexia bacterium]|nr:hypothetical protein [Chloroflexia bacterium]